MKYNFDTLSGLSILLKRSCDEWEKAEISEYEKQRIQRHVDSIMKEIARLNSYMRNFDEQIQN